MKFSDIPQFPRANYEVNIEWDYLEEHLGTKRGQDRFSLILEPDFQRGHVWSVEYSLMGGENSQVITTNCAGWQQDYKGPWELVDGLQRVTAVRRFMANEIKAFGNLFKDFEGRMRMVGPSFLFRVCNLPTRKEVLNLYLLLNAGGMVHSPEEISRVKKLLEAEK